MIADQGERITLNVEPRAVGITQGQGGEVFTVTARPSLDKQDLGELVSSSSGRPLHLWLTDGGKAIDDAFEGRMQICRRPVGAAGHDWAVTGVLLQGMRSS